MPDSDHPPHERGSALEVLKVCLRLGLTSFGGPIAHLGYFHNEYVKRRRWLDEQSYADLVALCQFLPGPASSQVGIAIGIGRAGLLGGIAAWLGFTLPSAVALVIFAAILQHFRVQDTGWVHGLMIAAVAVVAQAVWSMGRNLASDRARGSVALLSAIVAILWPTPYTQVLIIVLAGLWGWRFLGRDEVRPIQPLLSMPIRPRTGIIAWILFFLLLIGLPVARLAVHSQTMNLFDSFYRAGSLVFGGGHVVLPLLQRAVVPTGWVSNGQFLAGYGAAQAVPGPLFTFSAYLGYVMHPRPNGIIGAALALVAIFLPAFLLVIGALPFWTMLRGRPAFQSILRGINASVVGILLAALYNPVWTSAIRNPIDLALAIIAFGLLMWWKLPPWLVVLVSALGGWITAVLW
ncbi:MAG: chromate transporter [Alicyclobacillus sp.]|nr:chromate transporter [Alicyclobacillus sp.]